MFRTLLAASALFASAGAAQASDLGPRVIGGGDNAVVLYAEPSTNVVGGAVARLSGGSAAGGAQATVAGVDHVQAERRVARLVTGGLNATVAYGPARYDAAPSSLLAGTPGAAPRG